MRWLSRAALTASLALSACSLQDRDLPELYRQLAVPLARLSSPDLRSQGRILYRRDCVLCHGDLGDGRGVRAADLTPTPRDFTDPAWQDARDARHLYYAVAEGRHGTAMPPWKATLSPNEIWSLVAYVRSFDPRETGPDSDVQRPAPPQRAAPGTDR